MRKIYTLLFFVFETGSCYAAQAGPELTILLSQPQYSDSRCERPCLASLHQLLKSCIKEAVSEKSRQLTSTTDLSTPTFSWFKFFFYHSKKTLYVIITKVIWNLQQQQSLESLIGFVMSPVILVIQAFLGAQWCLKKQNRISWNV